MYLLVNVSVISDQRPSPSVVVKRVPLFTTTPATPRPAVSTTLPDTLKTVCRATPLPMNTAHSSNANNTFAFIPSTF